MLGFVFPGQGSQSVGMLHEIAAVYPEMDTIYKRASDVLGYDLWRLTQEGPADKLDMTVFTQPALLTASYAIWDVIQKRTTLQPTVLAGHSLGEYTALVAAKAISFEDGVRLVAARGEYMQEAVPADQGALAAIVGLSHEAVADLCQEQALDQVLAPANYNSPGQVVIAGNTEAITRAIQFAKTKGAKLAKQLAISVPSHCALMTPAAEKLALLLDKIELNQPVIPVMNNVDVIVYNSASTIRDGLKRQLVMPVRWVDIIQTFVTQGVTQVVECGPGKILTGLNKRITADIQFFNTASAADLQQILAMSFES